MIDTGKIFVYSSPRPPFRCSRSQRFVAASSLDSGCSRMALTHTSPSLPFFILKMSSLSLTVLPKHVGLARLLSVGVFCGGGNVSVIFVPMVPPPSHSSFKFLRIDSRGVALLLALCDSILHIVRWIECILVPIQRRRPESGAGAGEQVAGGGWWGTRIE